MLGIICFAIAFAWAAEEAGAACAGAAVRTRPVAAAATAAVVRAFFGDAMRRAMRETDTENLFLRGQCAADMPVPHGGGGACVGAAALRGTSAPCDVIQKNRPGGGPQ